MPRISSPWGNIFCKFGKEAAVCLDKTIIYTRDAGGTVTQKKVYALSTQANPCMIAGGEYLRLQAAGLAKETLGDFAIYTFVNTIPYELINSLAYAVGDTILTSNTNNKRSSGSTKKSTGTNGGSNNNSKKTPAPPSSRKGNIRPLTPMDPIINSWNFKNNNFHAW